MVCGAKITSPAENKKLYSRYKFEILHFKKEIFEEGDYIYTEILTPLNNIK